MRATAKSKGRRNRICCNCRYCHYLKWPPSLKAAPFSSLIVLERERMRFFNAHALGIIITVVFLTILSPKGQCFSLTFSILKKVLDKKVTTVEPSTEATFPTTTLIPQCSPPPVISRTSVTHLVTSAHDVARYSCYVSTDVYVRGTTDVTCKLGQNWPDATILCAPTTCWYEHPRVGPLFAGKLSVTREGKSCQPWALNDPQVKSSTYDSNSVYPSDNYSKIAAQNFCRVFDDGSDYTWCYWNESRTVGVLRKFSSCDVSLCDSVSGVRLD
ncbi:hypothetical protein ACOMHN_024991 [Nucella lapillus]